MQKYRSLATSKINTLSAKKKPVKSDQLFSGGHCFSTTNYFTRLKLTPTKNFYQLFFLLNKNQTMGILKKLSDLLYHNVAKWRWVGRVVKKEKFTAADQLKLLINTDSSSE